MGFTTAMASTPAGIISLVVAGLAALLFAAAALALGVAWFRGGNKDVRRASDTVEKRNRDYALFRGAMIAGIVLGVAGILMVAGAAALYYFYIDSGGAEMGSPGLRRAWELLAFAMSGFFVLASGVMLILTAILLLETGLVDAGKTKKLAWTAAVAAAALFAASGAVAAVHLALHLVHTLSHHQVATSAAPAPV